MQKDSVKKPQKSKPLNKTTNPVNDFFGKSFQMLIENKELMFQFVDMLPAQIEIFTPDGIAIFCNRATLEFNHITDAGLIVGKYNVLKDPILNDQMGLRDVIHGAFRGETVNGTYSPPVQDLVNRGIVEEKPFESAVLDFYFFPIWDPPSGLEDEVPSRVTRKLDFVISVCIVKNLYQGRPDVVRAKEYLDTHWEGEYVPEDIAKSMNMSVSHLYKIFKEHTGMTPGDYRKKVKVEHIKEKLADKNLSVKEAFAACGEDSQGWILRVFKKMTGLTPAQWRSMHYTP